MGGQGGGDTLKCRGWDRREGPVALMLIRGLSRRPHTPSGWFCEAIGQSADGGECSAACSRDA
jgi:hypothetical protein